MQSSAGCWKKLQAEDYSAAPCQKKQDEAVVSSLWQRVQVEVQAAEDRSGEFDHSYLKNLLMEEAGGCLHRS